MTGTSSATSFWEGSRDIRARSVSSRRKHRFHAIVDDEYLRLTSSDPGPGPEPGPDADPPAGAG